jgi:hypothetical protein
VGARADALDALDDGLDLLSVAVGFITIIIGGWPEQMTPELSQRVVA